MTMPSPSDAYPNLSNQIGRRRWPVRSGLNDDAGITESERGYFSVQRKAGGRKVVTALYLLLLVIVFIGNR
ncbi:Uncharacterized protein TCM_042099 [Theobroma cacao]|uniref:Uncharacterized protein n=1 Tax=Theobroma cacao TaxID=3641 RepID=A0A061GY91_THECC|nr:Uncharacterized protein TCM_042099 [Theobroma cacao]